MNIQGYDGSIERCIRKQDGEKMTGKNKSSERNAASSHQKGYIYTLEVLIAVSAILVTIVLVFNSNPEEADTSLPIIKQNAYDALFYLDKSDDLRKIVATEGITQLERNLTALLPRNIRFDAIICTTTCNSLSLPSNRTIIIVDYYIGGYREKFVNKKVRLWLWSRF